MPMLFIWHLIGHMLVTLVIIIIIIIILIIIIVIYRQCMPHACSLPEEELPLAKKSLRSIRGENNDNHNAGQNKYNDAHKMTMLVKAITVMSGMMLRTVIWQCQCDSYAPRHSNWNMFHFFRFFLHLSLTVMSGMVLIWQSQCDSYAQHWHSKWCKAISKST